MTRNERRQRRDEILAVASIAGLALLLVAAGWALRGALMAL